MELYMRCYPPRKHRVHCACAFHLHRILLCFHYMCIPVNLVLSCSRSPHVYYHVHPIWAPCDILCNNITCLDPCVLIGDTGEC
ncbi:hypothetical protein M6B38_377120 [Iris pallida]|uniref:Uncharacterized protein n=1 Tax=Iris pallida TaxID=29817 RepID=A0AAX6GAB1_IRIPA|nr:hypothetical protein M6B38_377120 [Iris pallida]